MCNIFLCFETYVTYKEHSITHNMVCCNVTWSIISTSKKFFPQTYKKRPFSCGNERVRPIIFDDHAVVNFALVCYFGDLSRIHILGAVTNGVTRMQGDVISE